MQFDPGLLTLTTLGEQRRGRDPRSMRRGDLVGCPSGSYYPPLGGHISLRIETPPRNITPSSDWVDVWGHVVRDGKTDPIERRLTIRLSRVFIINEGRL